MVLLCKREDNTTTQGKRVDLVIELVWPGLSPRIAHAVGQFGMIGLFLAGLVVASGYAMIPGNITGAMAQEASGSSSPIAPPFFLYGVSLFDFVAITGFGVSVIMAMTKLFQGLCCPKRGQCHPSTGASISAKPRKLVI